MSEKSKLLLEELSDSKRKIFIAKEDKMVVGVGKLRFDPEKKRAIVYGFYVKKEHEARGIAPLILKQCLKEVKQKEKSGIRIDTIRTSRYLCSEKRQPIFTRLATMVNTVTPGSVTTENYNWKGNEVVAFNFPNDIVVDLFEELGERFLKHL